MNNYLKKEAELRLGILVENGLLKDVLDHYKTDGTVYISERQYGFGILYWLDNYPELVKLVRDFENKHNAIVYHATRELTHFGECLDLFYVSKYKDEWTCDRNDLKEGCPLVYVANLDVEYDSEFGSITYERKGGGVVRTS